ncbi:MAG: GIY-YIG nuclease family protein [Symploca sp. SIO2G7]|nr:GIY-YIG nuclease family protein [Symploca sp. SIO2G7]
MTDEIRAEALKILEALIATPFSDGITLSRDFSTLTTRHSIYAIRHRTKGLLYIGKSQNPKQRFAGGHKALVWCWFERYDPDDVRIATYSLSYRQWATLSLELENIIIQATKPPFNVKIPMRE